MKILSNLKKLDVVPIVYHSLEQVCKVLATSEVRSTLEVESLLRIAQKSGLLNSNGTTEFPAQKARSSRKPFIVIEGLDGSGKTKISTALSQNCGLSLLRTPPEEIKIFKGFFDEQPEGIRRAFYSFGNYLAAKKVNEEINNGKSSGVIMDRYWHSTSCYALAHEMISNPKSKDELMRSQILDWPRDLLCPDAVIFLVVSEDVRKYRHALRATTNTKEEQTLANDSIFRQNLLECYKRVEGPPYHEINVDEEIEICSVKVFKAVIKAFPQLLTN